MWSLKHRPLSPLEFSAKGLPSEVFVRFLSSYVLCLLKNNLLRSKWEDLLSQCSLRLLEKKKAALPFSAHTRKYSLFTFNPSFKTVWQQCYDEVIKSLLLELEEDKEVEDSQVSFQGFKNFKTWRGNVLAASWVSEAPWSNTSRPYTPHVFNDYHLFLFYLSVFFLILNFLSFLMDIVWEKNVKGSCLDRSG